MLKLGWREICAWRMHRQFLHRRAPTSDILAVASRLCGLHAQVLSSAELTLWARVEGLERGAVQRALWEDRTLVKTWAMRGTLHLLPAAELPLWHAALATNRRYLTPRAWQSAFGITLEELDRITDAIGAALNRRMLTREELSAAVAHTMGSASLGAKITESSWGTILRPAAFSGRLCFAPSLGQRVRFTHPGTWFTANVAPVDPEAATLEVTRRYLRAYGPATYRDLARWWAGGGVSNGRQWMTALGEEARAVDVDGAPAWMLKSDVDEARESSTQRSVRLLPGFDQYVVAASHHAERLMPVGFRKRIYRMQGWISPVLLVDGRMAGTWRHEVKGSCVAVAIEPFSKAPTWVRRAAGVEAERLAAFLGGKLNLSWIDEST